MYIGLIYDGPPRGQHHLTRAGVGRARLLQQEQVTRDTRDNNVTRDTCQVLRPQLTLAATSLSLAQWAEAGLQPSSGLRKQLPDCVQVS